MSQEGRAEEAPTSSEQELRLLVDAIPTLVWRAAPDGNFEYVNKRMLEYLGAPLNEVIGWGWMDKVHPDDVAFKVRSWLQNLESGTPHDVVCRIRGADGRYRWFEVRGEPLRASGGTVLSWYGVLIDIDDRRRAEEALRESEYKLRQIIDTVPGLIWSTGPDGEPTHVSQGLLDYSGMRFEDFKHVGWKAFVHPDDFPETTKAYYHAIQSGTSYQGVVRLRRADGEFRWHHARCEPLRDRHGRIVQWYGLSVDIDEGKQAADQLRRSEAYLAEAQRLSHTGSFGWTPSTGELHWSDETFRILEYDPSIKPTIERALQRVHPDDVAMMRRVLDEASRGEMNFNNTHRLLMPDGSVKFMHVLLHVSRNAAGNLEIVGAFMDVTENTGLYGDLAEREARLVERTTALRRSEAYLAEAQQLSQTGSVAFNETSVLYFSDETYRILGFDPRQGLPSREAVAQRMHPDDRESALELGREGRGQKRDYKLGYRFILPNGTIKYIETTSHPKFAASGELVEVVSTIVDVTERKRAQHEHERLRQLESDLAHMNRLSMMGELAASLAHEITQPIAAARNNAHAALNFLDNQPPDLGEVRAALDCVLGDADRAGVIIDRIRDHVKKTPPRKHRFDLNVAIDEVIGLAQSAIAKNGVSVQTRLTEGLHAVQGDRVQLQQVVLNLLLNAVEAMGAVDEGERELLLSTEQSPTNGVLVAVRDSGPGIDPDHIERIFEAFYTTKAAGMGMGLSICRSIIDAHGGRLWAAANEPCGAVFQFTLPSHERSS